MPEPDSVISNFADINAIQMQLDPECVANVRRSRISLDAVIFRLAGAGDGRDRLREKRRQGTGNWRQKESNGECSTHGSPSCQGLRRNHDQNNWHEPPAPAPSGSVDDDRIVAMAVDDDLAVVAAGSRRQVFAARAGGAAIEGAFEAKLPRIA